MLGLGDFGIFNLFDKSARMYLGRKEKPSILGGVGV
jgi:hypothetical protein